MSNQLKRENTVFRLPKTNGATTKENVIYPPVVSIPSVDEIYFEEKDEKTGELVGINRVIRYVPGERSIYADEQSKGAEKKLGEVPSLVNGQLVISFREATLLKYLSVCNYNGSNPKRDPSKNIIFTELKKGEDAAKFIQGDKLETDLKHKIYSMTPNELEATAMLMEIPNWDMKLTEELQRDLIVIAKRDSSFFQKQLSDKGAKKRYHILKSIREGYVRVDESANMLVYKTGKEIIQAPLHEDVITFSINYFSTNEGEGHYNHILSLLYPEEKQSVSQVQAKQVEFDNNTELNDEEELNNKVIDSDDSDYNSMPTSDLIHEAIANNVVVVAGIWFKAGEFKVKGKHKFAEEVESNEELRATIIHELETVTV